MAYEAITSGEVDLDSPITEGLMQKIRNNQAYHEALFDESTGHKHDGTADGGAPITSLPETVTAAKDVLVSGTLTAAIFVDYYNLFLGRW